MSAPSWELSKENVAPLARGRDKAALKVALHATRNEVAAMHAAHEEAVDAAAAGRGPHAADPLAPAAAFVKWAAEAYPPRAPPLLAALERSCRAFVDDARYNNDPRLVRLWVRYADAREDPLDCFAYMRSHSIGGESALFYEAWATTLEYKKDFKAADTAYKLGLDRDAQPRNRLEQRQLEFLARMVARDRRAEAKAARALQRQSGKSQKSSSRHDLNATADENVRPALGALSTQQATSGRRPALAAANLPSSTRGGGLKARPALASKTDKSGGNVDNNFQVFVDPELKESEVARKNDDMPLLPKLAPLDQEKKENEGELPSQWAGVVVPQNESMAKARARAGSRQRPREANGSFDIHCDNEDDVNGGDSGRPSEEELDESRRAADTMAKRGKWTAAGPASPTINTKIAMQEVEDMFNSTLPYEHGGHHDEDQDHDEAMSSRSRGSTPKRPTAPAFDIFCDEPEATPEKNGGAHDGTDKENAGGRRSTNSRSRGEVRSPADVFRRMPELEGGIDLKDPSTFVEVEYTPLTAPAGAARPGTPEEVSGKLEDWCIESCPDLPGYEMMEGDCGELTNGNLVCFEGGAGESRSFFVESKLGVGKGGKSVVYAATPIENAADEDDEQIYAIKASDNVNLLWEFYVYNAVSSRLPSDIDRRGRQCVPRSIAFYHGEPLSYLLTDRISVATLADIIVLATNVQSCKLNFQIVTFFLIELLRSVEVVHSVGVIHADVTLENVIIRKDSTERWTGGYNTTGKSGWAGKGVALIDFNHAVDARHPAVGGWSAEHLLVHTAFLGNSHMNAESGISPNAPWGFNADCLAIATCGCKLAAACAATGSMPVLDDVVSKLSSVPPHALGDDTVDVMRQCRYALEEALIAACSADDGAAVRSSLKAVFVAAAEASQAGDVTQG